MGQAKKRGTKEQRIEQAIIRRDNEVRQWEKDREEKRIARQNAHDSLTPEEQAVYRTEHPEYFRKRGDSKHVLTAASCFAAAYMFSGGYDYRRY